MTLCKMSAFALLMSSILMGCNQPHKPVASIPQPTQGQATGPPGNSLSTRVHSSGTVRVLFEGVYMPPASPGEDGPYASRQLDLDQGIALTKSDISSDLGLSVNARTLLVIFQPATGKAVDVGSQDPGVQNCTSYLSNAQANLATAYQPPTNYVCLRTGEGRVSIFRVLTITRQPTQQNLVNILLTVEYTTLEAAS